MEDSHVFERMEIQSHKGIYTVVFETGFHSLQDLLSRGVCHYLVDANVARLYPEQLHAVLDHPHTLVIEATEENKSIQKVVPVIEKLVANRARRDHILVAIGGGIIQDITCFIASTLLRGMMWRFLPTTLLAQADSCIGSKSSINLGAAKNILGTFNPPDEIHVYADFLDTLEHKEILSGIGEILKVHAIDGRESFDRVSRDYDSLLNERAVLLGYIRAALEIKKRFIEVDEFDRGVRNIFNYGHSFGHAIESATDFAVPHGIAVSMGMDMANRIASLRGILPFEHYERMHGTLYRNYSEYAGIDIPLDALISALMKDKKNTSTTLGLVFATGDNSAIERLQVDPDELFRKQCCQSLQEMRA